MKSPNFKKVTFYIGIDMHLKSWTVTIRSQGIELKTFSMNPSAEELNNYLKKHYPDGIFKIVYDPPRRTDLRDSQHTGNSKNWDCIVVNPADIPSTNKEKVVKIDPS